MSNLKIDIEGVDFKESNITFVNGLTMEKVRLHYNWLLNAKVKDVILGEDDYGIVWYFGDWYCGEWVDGTWYSGNFFNGTWNNGKWYSYKLHKIDIVNEKIIIQESSKEYSMFHNGLWKNGIWNDGIFGEDSIEEWYNFTKFDFLNTDYNNNNNINVPIFKIFKEEMDSYIQWKKDTNQILTYFTLAFRKARGYFSIDEKIKLENYGILNDYYKITDINYDINDNIESFLFTVTDIDKINEIHTHLQDEITYGDYKIIKIHSEDSFDSNLNSIYVEETKDVAIWLNGNWKQGLFQNATWDDGVFEAGLFLNSKWIDGIFYDGVFDGDTWYDGEWMNGDFIRGKWMNGVFTKLNQNKLSRFGASKTDVLETICEWYDGEWKNGDWFSGYQKVDEVELSFNNKLSIWYNGIWKNGTWYGGHFKSGTWFYGIWKDGIFGDIKNTDFISASNVYENIDLDGFVYENKTFDGFGSFWSNDSGELIKDIIAGESPSSFDSSVIQKHIQINHDTNIGGWFSGETSPRDYYSGATEDSGKITLYIRDNFSQTEYDLKQQLVNKKFDYTYELSLPHIIEIGGSGFTASSVTFVDDQEHQLYYFIDMYDPSGYHPMTAINPFAYTPPTPQYYKRHFRVRGAYTKVVINEYEVGLVDKINTFDNITIKTKDILKYENGNGSGTTYLEFNNALKNDQSLLEFTTITQPSDYLYTLTGGCIANDPSNESNICIDDTRDIFVEIDSDNISINNILSGTHTIKEIFFDFSDNLYHIVTKTHISNSLNESGKILNYSYMNRFQKSKQQHILFQDFNHNLNITNYEEVLGVQINYNIKFNKNSKNSELYDYDTILPFKNLFFIGYAGGSLNYDNTFDYDNYDMYLNTYEFFINGKKQHNTELQNNNDIIIGSLNDTWDLENLVEYYNTPYIPNDYNIKKISSVLNNIRISKSFQTKKFIDEDFSIEKMGIKLYYIDNSNVWYNGIFEKGVWLNGHFENGKMISSLIISGNFNNGNLGYEENDDRANRRN